MKKRMLIVLTAVGLLVGAIAGPALAAQGGPVRYQVGTTAYTVRVLDTYTHTFVVTANPCDGSIAITGATPTDGGYYTTETVTGTLTSGVISFSATYDGPYNPGYAWSGSFPIAGGALSGDFTGTVTMGSTTSTTYRNHGDYVSSMGGGADAAHSCIGMPMTSAADAAAADIPPKALVNQARMTARLDALIASIKAGGHASTQASAAIQKHVDSLTAGTAGTGHAKTGIGATQHPTKPTLPAAATGHPTPASHPGKP